MKARHDGDCTVYAAMINRMPTDGICTCGFAHYHLGREPYGKHDELLYSDERREATWPKSELKNKGCSSCGSKKSNLMVNGNFCFGCSECGEDYFKPADRKARRRGKDGK